VFPYWFVQPVLSLAGLAERQHGVIARRQGIGLGLTRGSVARQLASRRWERVHSGVYRVVGSPRTWKQQILAACLAAGPGAVASHHSAARIWSIPRFDDRLEVTIPHSRRPRFSEVVIHRSRVVMREARRVDSVPVTSPARTLIDLAATADPEVLAAALDHVLVNRLATVSQMRRVLDSMGRSGRRGAAKVAEALAQRPTGPRSLDSAFEARLFRVLKRSALPLPVTQYGVRLPGGRRARLDFAYPQVLLGIEADGYRYHSSVAAWSKDRVRHNELVALGWRVLPITYQDLRANPEMIIQQVRRALEVRLVGSVVRASASKRPHLA
jgi:very-short-patch-repair endonuclease